MELVFSEEHYRILLKDAPYVDLDSMREKLIESCEGLCKIYNYPDLQERVAKYKAGDAPTLPNEALFRDRLFSLLRSYSEANDDLRFDYAMRSLRRFFFEPSYWSPK